MTHLAVLAGILALAASSAFGGPSLTSAFVGPGSRLTELSGERCRAEAGRAASHIRCPGLGGASVLVTATPDMSAVGLSWSAKALPRPLVADVDRGAPIEWRGVPTAKGFEPHAALVRLRRVRDGLPGVAVIRVRAGEACLAGTLDGSDAARRVADEPARSGDCRRDGLDAG